MRCSPRGLHRFPLFQADFSGFSLISSIAAISSLSVGILIIPTAVKEISIVPRGVAGGYTMYKSDEDKSFISKTEMEEKLIALLGGRAAEKIVLDDISTGASNDIEVATEIAKNMVTVYGMSDVVGPICLKSSDGNYEYQLLGNNMEDIIGQEVKKLIDLSLIHISEPTRRS